MESAIATSEPTVFTPLMKENLMHISTEIIPHEVANRSSVDLQSSSHITMQTQPNNEINVGVIEARNLAFNVLQEVTQFLLETNQEGVNVMLDSMKGMWKNEELFELVEECYEDSNQTFDFCNALEKCLKSVQEIRTLIFIALKHFEEKMHVKTLEDLKNLKAMGDPFSKDFFKIFQFMYRFVYRRQNVLVKKLQRNKLKLNNKVKYIQIWRKVCNVIFLVPFVAALIFGVVAAAMAAPVVAIATPAAATILLSFLGICMNSFLKNYMNAMKREKEVITSMQMGGFVGIKDLDSIKVLVDRVEIDVRYLINKAEYALGAIDKYKAEEVVKRGIEEMKKKLDSFVNKRRESREACIQLFT